jgi:recombination protein RecA
MPKSKKDEKNARIDSALATITKKFGAGTAVQLGKQPPMEPIDSFSTGSILGDHMIGCGGIPRGRITEVNGPDGGGKTTSALQVVANAQAQGENAAYIDGEQAFDPIYAAKLGVNVPALYLAQPEYGEKAIEIILTLLETKAFGIVVMDSVPSLIPKVVLESDVGDMGFALIARLLSVELPRQLPILRKTNTAMIYINQVRDRMNAYPGQSTTQTPGGRAFKHSASLRLEIRRKASLKDGDRVIGARTVVKMIKNKVGGAPYTTFEYDMIYGYGISREAEVIELGVKCGVLEKEGSVIIYKNQRLGNGREAARRFLVDTPEVMVELLPLVKEAVKHDKDLQLPSSPADAE